MGHDERVAIIGLGYVGLPLAISFVEAGLAVVGVDASAARVAELRDGRSPIDDIDDDRLRAALDAGFRVAPPAEARLGRCRRDLRLRPDADHRREGPDLGPVLSAAAVVRADLRPGQLDRAPVDDVPGHDDRPVPRRSSRGPASSPAATSTSPSPRSG